MSKVRQIPSVLLHIAGSKSRWVRTSASEILHSALYYIGIRRWKFVFYLYMCKDLMQVDTESYHESYVGRKEGFVGNRYSFGAGGAQRLDDNRCVSILGIS